MWCAYLEEQLGRQSHQQTPARQGPEALGSHGWAPLKTPHIGSHADLARPITTHPWPAAHAKPLCTPANPPRDYTTKLLMRDNILAYISRNTLLDSTSSHGPLAASSSSSSSITEDLFNRGLSDRFQVSRATTAYFAPLTSFRSERPIRVTRKQHLNRSCSQTCMVRVAQLVVLWGSLCVWHVHTVPRPIEPPGMVRADDGPVLHSSV